MASNFAKLVATAVAQEKGDLPIAEDFEFEFCKFHNDRTKERAKRISSALKPSQFKACVRMLWYYQHMPSAMDAQGAVNVDLLMTAEVGSAFHVIMQGYLDDMTAKGYRIRNLDIPKYVETLPARGIFTKVTGRADNGEWRMRNEGNFPLPINFQLDGLIEFKDRVWVWDLKTCDSRTLQSLIESRQKDREQLIGYLLLLGLPGVWFTYLCRDNGKRRHFPWYPTEAEKQDVRERIAFQAAQVQLREPPPCEAHRCKASYCPFRAQCKKDGGEPQ